MALWQTWNVSVFLIRCPFSTLCVPNHMTPFFLQCDGQRPTCSTCRAKRLDCISKERDKVRVDETSIGLLNPLTTFSQDEAFDLLQRLRAGSERFCLFPATSERRPPLSLEHAEQYRRGRSPDSTSHHISESRLATNPTGIELELMMRYPVAYPCLCPVDVEPALFESLPTLALPTPGLPTPGRSSIGARQAANRLRPTKHAVTYVTNQCYSSSTGLVGSPEVHMSGVGTETASVFSWERLRNCLGATSACFHGRAAG